jgi:hypothetical protein
MKKIKQKSVPIFFNQIKKDKGIIAIKEAIQTLFFFFFILKIQKKKTKVLLQLLLI